MPGHPCYIHAVLRGSAERTNRIPSVFSMSLLIKGASRKNQASVTKKSKISSRQMLAYSDDPHPAAGGHYSLRLANGGAHLQIELPANKLSNRVVGDRGWNGVPDRGASKLAERHFRPVRHKRRAGTRFLQIRRQPNLPVRWGNDPGRRKGVMMQRGDPRRSFRPLRQQGPANRTFGTR